MRSIEELVESYNTGHNTRINQILHALGILVATIGMLAFLWSLPSEAVKSWLGDHPFANWATIFAVLMIIYYGSQSFTLTFAGGIFYQGLLFLIEYVERTEIIGFSMFITLCISIGFLFMIVGHAIQGNIKEIKHDLTFFMIAPTWLFHFVYKWAGVKF